MEVWTEVLDEEVALVHIGGRKVLVPISPNVRAKEIEHVKDEIVAREAHRRQREALCEQLA